MASVKGPDGKPGSFVPVTLLDQHGASIATVMTDSGGSFAAPAGAQVASLRVQAPGLGSVVVPVGPGDVANIPVRIPTPRTVIYGQVIAPTGEGLGGVGVSVRGDSGVVLATSVSDPNGVWALSAPARADANWRLVAAGKTIEIADPATAGLIGPEFIQLEAVPTALAGVAPISALLTTDAATAATMIARSPGLWSRGISAIRQDPCNPYAPADATLEVRRFAHLVLLPEQAPAQVNPQSKASLLTHHVGPGSPSPIASALGVITAGDSPQPHPGVRYGILFDLEQDWQGVGQALGDLIYSLPLAPCEEVNLAVIDWQASQSGERASTTMESVQQNLAFARKRVIDDVASASTKRDWESSNIGATISASYAGVTASATVGHNWGDSLTTSTQRSTQNLSDAIEQSAAVQRDARMVTIVQVSESERVNTSTRVVRNHNHAHTLTIQHYEVLQRYLVTTAVSAVQPVLMVPFAPMYFDGEVLDQHGEVLLARLRDSTLLDELTRWLNRYPLADQAAQAAAAQAQQQPAPAPSDDPLITLVSIDLHIPDELHGTHADNSQNLANWMVITKPDGSRIRFTQHPDEDGWHRLVTAVVSPPVPLSGLVNARLSIEPEDGDESWSRAHYSIDLKLQHEDGTLTERTWDDVWLPPGVDVVVVSPQHAAPTPPAPAAAPTPPWAPSQRLLAHFQANALFYTAAILLDGDPLLLWWLLSQIQVSGRAVTDMCDPEIVVVQGNYLALRMASADDMPEAVRNEIPPNGWAAETYRASRSQTVVVLPSGGTYAEAQLGHCSAAEKIDDTVFWKWQEAPCDDSAPAITDEMIKSRVADLKDLLTFASTDLSASTIETPSAPDPQKPPSAGGDDSSSDSSADSSSSSSADSSSSSADSSSSSSSSSADGSSSSSDGSSSSSATGSAGSTIGTASNPWILDDYGIGDDQPPAAPKTVTSETASALYAGISPTTFDELLDHEIVPGIRAYLGQPGHANTRIGVDGFSDKAVPPGGPADYNVSLSARRAARIADVLAQRLGISRGQFDDDGKGDTASRGYPDDDGQHHNAHDRRVQIYLET